MTCETCGANIADKAIVCYRCGAPTPDVASRETPVPVRRSGRVGVVVGAVLSLAGVALAASAKVMGQTALAVGILAVAVGLFVLWRSR